MEDELKYVKSGLSELNLRLSSLSELLKSNFIQNDIPFNNLRFEDIQGIKSISESFLNQSNTPIDKDNINRLLEIKEIINTLNYDLDNIKTGIINTDDELKQQLESVNTVLQLGNNSIRERLILLEKKQKLESEIKDNNIEITPFYAMGYTGRPEVNNKTFETVEVKQDELKSAGFNITEQIALSNSLKQGFRSAGYALSSSIANAIVPMGKVNDLASAFLNTFIEVTARALLFKTIMSGLDIVTGGLTDLTSGKIPFAGNAVSPIYNDRNLSGLVNKYPQDTRTEIALSFPKVEFRQTGYDLKAVINKVEKSLGKYQ